MHDINRTQQETGWETGLVGESEYGDFESEYMDFESEFDDSEYDESEYEYDDSEYDESEDEMYAETYEEYESSYGQAEGPLDEAEEMELASELLEITDEEELDQFIGKIFSKVRKAVGKVIPRRIRRRVGKFAKRFAKKVLPAAGAIAGNFFAPGVGGMIGKRLGSVGTKVLGLELEGLSPEDQEFEIARRYVRLVSDAAQEASVASPGAHSEDVAERAVMTAVKKHAPGLLARPNGQSARTKQHTQKRMTKTRGAGVRVIRMRPGEEQVKLVILRG